MIVQAERENLQDTELRDAESYPDDRRARLEAVLRDVADDAAFRAETYPLETAVPEGGE